MKYVNLYTTIVLQYLTKYFENFMEEKWEMKLGQVMFSGGDMLH